MPLTDVQVRNAKPELRPVRQRSGKTNGSAADQVPARAEATGYENKTLSKQAPQKLVTTKKPYKLADGKGLYLEVNPSGGKYWRFKYRFAQKEKRISLGVYPEVRLEEARNERDKA